jgi:hypothetical protein
MKVQITDSFTKSLKRLIWHQHWLYKTYALFRYDIPLFVKNVWRFRNELWDHQWWDYRFTLNMLERSLTIMEDGMASKGWEVRETREPKVKAMRRALELLKNNREDNYTERAEAELGPLVMHEWEFEEVPDKPHLSMLVDKDTPEEKEHNRRVFARAREIEQAEWKELWEIFKGTKRSTKYGKSYDGTDMRAWWD